MEKRDAHVQQDGETAFVHQHLVVQFKAVYIIIRPHDADFGQQLATVQPHLLPSDLDLFIQDGIFGTGTDIGNLDIHPLFDCRIITGNTDIGDKRFPDQMAKIHSRQPQGVLRFTDGEFAFVQLHLHFQDIVLRFQAMFVSALDIRQQFPEHSVIFIRHLFHLLRLHDQGIGFVCFEDHFRRRQRLVHLGHLFPQDRHPVGSPDLTAHIKRLLDPDSAHVDCPDFIIEIDTGEMGINACRDQVPGCIIQNNGHFATFNSESAVRRTVKGHPVSGKVREEIPFIAFHRVQGTFGLFHRCRHFLIILQRHFPALLQAQRLLCEKRRRAENRQQDNRYFLHQSTCLI